jgi:hypothetical protein
MTILQRNVVEYAEIDFSDGYQVRLEHEHEKKYDTHTVTFKRRNIDPDHKDKQIYSDIQFNLDTEHFKQFCKFFNTIGERYGNE